MNNTRADAMPPADPKIRPNNTKGCLATASSKLSTSRVSTASGSDAATSALEENATASASSTEIQALQELRHRFVSQDMAHPRTRGGGVA
jgi:hypothetical protein